MLEYRETLKAQGIDPDASATLPTVDPDGGSLTITGTPAPGKTITVSGTSSVANGLVDIELHSDPVVLATVTSDATGAFSAQVTLPAGLTGEHTLVATVAGQQIAASTTVSLITNVGGASDDEASDGDGDKSTSGADASDESRSTTAAVGGKSAATASELASTGADADEFSTALAIALLAMVLGVALVVVVRCSVADVRRS